MYTETMEDKSTIMKETLVGGDLECKYHESTNCKFSQLLARFTLATRREFPCKVLPKNSVIHDYSAIFVLFTGIL